MGTGGINRTTKNELILALRQRYLKAQKMEKTKILDEFTALTKFHRKHAIRLLRKGSVPPMSSLSSSVNVGRRVYDQAVKDALIIVWEAADRICGKRLKAIIPNLVSAMERHGHLDLDPKVRELLLAASPATIDRLLAPVRRKAKKRRKPRTKKKVSKKVPVRTFADWNDPVPGFMEIDFVVHSGPSMAGSFVNTLSAVDVCSGWIELVPLLAREQSLVIEALGVIRGLLPIPLLGIDCDNDSTFINDTLFNYCEQNRLELTRSRPYHKNDQAWIEQKNGSVVRRFTGYDRYSGDVAGQVFVNLYSAVRLYVNFFQPSFKLLEKWRDGARIVKKYDNPKTPCERLLENDHVAEKTKIDLMAKLEQLDPVELLHRIRDAQAALAALTSSEPGSSPGQESLEKFLAQLPDLWRSGEVRPTHRKQQAGTRLYRTRKDPFEGVWTEILLWLQQNPDATAKSLFQNLQGKHSGQFKEGQLRTLQRRVKDWRRVMAKKLVYACLEEEMDMVDTVLIGPGLGED